MGLKKTKGRCFSLFVPSSLLMLGLMSMSYAYVDVFCHTLDFIMIFALSSPLFSANSYAFVVVSTRL